MKRIRPFNTTLRETELSSGDNHVQLPRRAQILSVSYDARDALFLALIVDPDADRQEERRFYVVEHGSRVPHNVGALLHVGSARSHWTGMALHVFEVNSPEDTPRVGSARGSVINQQNAPVHGGVSIQAHSILGGGVTVQPGVMRT